MAAVLRGPAEPAVTGFDDGILKRGSGVTFFPVRHHSPACARLVVQLIRELRPVAVLIEGPSDYNPQFGELYKAHELPIAIYSYVRFEEERPQGAFYPFCIYSPEWQALQAAREVNAKASFIDLPWAEQASLMTARHLYADGEERRSEYFNRLAAEFGVEDYDSVWDTLVEIDFALDLDSYLDRAHRLMYYARREHDQAPVSDQRREAYMLEQIQSVQSELGGPVVVVTGGFHSYALYCGLHGLPFEVPSALPDLGRRPVSDRGISLTPYSYERLDSLTGYDAGMPNPGFYHQVWEDRACGRDQTWRGMLAAVAKDLRRRKQQVSAADLIAVETSARGLATLRAHATPWRQDLVDGITGSLVKEPLTPGTWHPFLAAVNAAMRGGQRGVLAPDTALPPIVADIKRQIKQLDLELRHADRNVVLDLHDAADLQRARILHQLRILPITGYQLTHSGDLTVSTGAVVEQWLLRWSVEFEAQCIEAAIYGASLEEASRARVLDLAKGMERAASDAAKLLLDACVMGFGDLGSQFHELLLKLLREDNDFFSVASALAYLVYLYRYDDVLGVTGNMRLGALVTEAYERTLWLLEGLGRSTGREPDLIAAMRQLRETQERCGAVLSLPREYFILVFSRVADQAQWTVLRGAAAGTLWSLHAVTSGEIVTGLAIGPDPEDLGDYLDGLFRAGREVAQRHPELVTRIDQLIMHYNDEEFLEALASLRFAFSFFTPREKDHLAGTLLAGAKDLPALEVPVAMAADAYAWESRLFAELARYGVRGGQ